MRARLGMMLAVTLLATGCGSLVQVRPTGTFVLDPPKQTSRILASDGSALADLHAGENREVIPLTRIPKVVQDAVVALEDRRFYLHEGVDPQAIARALMRNTAEGEVREGGSTITQQLVKNVATGNAQTLERKLEEASLALQLEAAHTKDEILEHYLNTVYFGNNAYGVQAAAERYFATDAQHLGLREAALLAALLKAPANYDPITQPQAALARRNVALDVMARSGFVSESQAEQAKATDLGLRTGRQGTRWRAPYFTDHVLALLQHDPTFKVLGDRPVERARTLFNGGLRIETTLDPVWQEAAEAALAATLDRPRDPAGAVIALDPQTGGIRALVGGRDYYDADDRTARFNLATDAARQPGSTFKAIVLAAALAEGASLEDIYDAPSALVVPPRPPREPQPWRVRNYTGVDFGEITLREGTAFSVNAVYAQLVDEIGPEAVVRMAHRLGVRRPLRPYRSIALGAQEVSPLEMASVQATLAAGGVYRPPSAVTRIVAPDGTVLYERGAVPGERVLKPEVAWLTTTALRQVVDAGTGVRASIHRPLAGKTGTTQRGADAWFTGYTPDLAAAVWIGFPQGAIPMEPPRTRIAVEGGNWPSELFARFASRALDAVPAHDFAVPESKLVRVEVDTTRGCLPNPYTPPESVAVRPFLRGTEPTVVCTQPTAARSADVPTVLGLPRSTAERRLSSAGFTVEVAEEFSQQLPPGYVVRQVPEAGQARRLPEGYVARIFVSSADRSDLDVPDVLNLPAPDAVATLEAQGFVVELVTRCPGGGRDCTGAAERPGSVWEQQPSPGQRAVVHSVVRLQAYPEG